MISIVKSKRLGLYYWSFNKVGTLHTRREYKEYECEDGISCLLVVFLLVISFISNLEIPEFVSLPTCGNYS